MKIIEDVKSAITQNRQLILVSFISLFLELLVIRLISTEIRIFAYLSNLVLLAAFMGLGSGMIIKRKVSITLCAVSTFLAVVAASANYIVRWPNLDFRFFSGVTELLSPLSESYIWLQTSTFSKTGIVVGLILLFLLFINIVLIFIPLGQIIGNLLKNHKKPITAYSVNIIASLTGLWAFQVFSLIRFTPYFGIVLALFFLIFTTKDRFERFFILAVVVATIATVVPKEKLESFTYWSPYQKLTLSAAEKDPSERNPQPEGWYLEVNNVGYMALLNISKDYQRIAKEKLQELYSDQSPIDTQFSDSYSLPFKFKPLPKDVLIIGAGAGNDAAAAVREGQTLLGPKGEKPEGYEQKIPKIDAVEIDPTIVEIGEKYHHEKPYRETNVNVIVDDGRSVMEKTNKKYDLVIMGLADSHTLSSSLTNLRLDHYLYTKESLERIYEILKDDGVLFLTFEVTRPWIGDRLNRGLVDVFGQQPEIFEVRSGGVYGWGGYAFVTAKNPQNLKNIISNNPALGDFIEKNRKTFNTDTKPLTDNWPYLYLDKPRLPILHIIIASVFAAALFLLRKKLLGTSTLNWPMFLWGAAFLLFEFQNISKTSLLFGITWTTNLFTISAILILLLLSNLTVAKKLISPKVAFVFLIASLIVQLVVPIHIFSSFNYLSKITAASFFLNLPVYFGGIIFTSLFVKAKDKANAMGSNFLGSVFGGLAEMITFVFGIHSLLIFVILFYAAGFTLARYLQVAKN